MRKYNKTVALLLVLCLTLVACSSGNTGNKKNESTSNGGGGSTNSGTKVVDLNFWVPFSGTDGEYMENMVKAYNESQSEVNVKFMNSNWDNYYPKLQTALVSNSAPDVAVAHVSKLASLMPTEKVAVLDDLATEAGLDWSTFSENQLQATVIDGKHYAVPLDTHAVIMYFNKKHLNDAGLLNEDGTIKMEQTAEGFTEVLRALKKTIPADVSPLIIGSNNVFTYWIWYALVNQQGGSVFTDGQPTINTPEAKVAMELIKSWIDEGLALPDIGDQSYDIFKTGNAAVTFSGVWATGNFETNKDLDFAAVPFPQLFAQPAAWGDSHTVFVPTQDNKEKQVAALKFADWLASNGHMWAVAGHVPVKTAVLESEDYTSLPYRSSYADVINDVVYGPKLQNLGSIEDTILESLVEINYGMSSVEDGLAKAQKNAETILNK